MRLQVDELISRIQGVVPCPLVGGVAQPNAWGENPWGGKRSLRGALFLGNRTYHEGAVGCFMRGPIQVPHNSSSHMSRSTENTGLCMLMVPYEPEPTTQLHMDPEQELKAWQGGCEGMSHELCSNCMLKIVYVPTLSSNFRAKVFFDTSLALQTL